MEKKQLKFYKKLLKLVCEDPDTDKGFCYYVGILTKNKASYRKYWPELFDILVEIKPGSNSLFGNILDQFVFSRDKKGWEKRIQILHDLIQEHD